MFSSTISSFNQLKDNVRTSEDLDWSEKALELSQKLLDLNQFRLAKNLLLVLEIKTQLQKQNKFTEMKMQYIQNKNFPEGKICQVKEKYSQWENIFNKLHQTWFNYCNSLLEKSKQFVEERKKASTTLKISNETLLNDDSFKEVGLITEDNLPCRFPRDRKFECPDGYVKEYSEAKIIFLVGRNSATKLNKISTNENMEIAKGLNNLYRILAFYEGQRFLKENTHNRLSKMHKRRVTLWKSFVNQQNDDVRTERFLLNELQLAYLDLLEVKLKIFEKTSGSLQPVLFQKMAYICKTGAKINDRILETFKEQLEKNNLKNDEEVRQVLLAWFYKARFLNKFFSPNREEQIDYSRAAIKNYEMVLCYCARNMEAKKLIPEEYKTSRGTADMLKRQVKLHEKEKSFDEKK